MNTADPSNVESPELRQVAAAARGDRDARHDLFVRHREAAYRTALRIIGRHEDALDVVQDSYIRAFERLDSFQGESGFATWLLRIVTNRALDLLRSRKVRLAASLDPDDDGRPRVEPPAAPEAGSGRNIEREELARRLHQAIESLPPEQRAVFALHAAGELTYGQIAEILGVPAGTVMSRLYHARRRLHERLADLAPGREAESG